MKKIEIKQNETLKNYTTLHIEFYSYSMELSINGAQYNVENVTCDLQNPGEQKRIQTNGLYSETCAGGGFDTVRFFADSGV